MSGRDRTGGPWKRAAAAAFLVLTASSCATLGTGWSVAEQVDLGLDPGEWVMAERSGDPAANTTGYVLADESDAVLAPATLKGLRFAVPQKRVYGGCQAVPTSLVAQLGGPYVCGWGGYTSLVMNGGNASIGPTMYAIPDPDTIADGATSVPVRVVLDAANAQTNRGVRKTIPLNYFDGGDTRH